MNKDTARAVKTNVQELVKTRQLPGTAEWLQCIGEEIAGHRVALATLAFFIAGLTCMPPLLLIAVLMIAGWSAFDAAGPAIAGKTRKKLLSFLPDSIRNSDWLVELADGIGQLRPFILAAVYFLCVPIGLVWMLCHWAMRVLNTGQRNPQPTTHHKEALLFQQERQDSNELAGNNFFHSPAFSITTLALFGSGIPAAIAYAAYNYLGIDAILGYPSRDPRFWLIAVVVCMYIYSIAWAASVLFFRAWFTFPLNFLGYEHYLELNPDGIRKHSFRGWFASVLSFNFPGKGRNYINWREVKYLHYSAGSALKIYPLPDKIIPSSSVFYKFLNKCAALLDAVLDRGQRRDFIAIATGLPGNHPLTAFSQGEYPMTINLWELNAEQKARFFYAVRKWAPHAIVDEKLQLNLIDSTVMKDKRYTEIWFHLLSERKKPCSKGSLKKDHMLKNKSYHIKEKIACGGQGSVYLAEMNDGMTCILKEFILSSSDAVGSLIESGRDFENEASILSRLDHPGIVKLLDLFVEDRRAYLVLEHVQGQSLRQAVEENGPFPQERVLTLAIQMCDLLSYLHGQTPALIHRDFTPDNIILGRDDSLKLIDFSLSTPLEVTKALDCAGKHAYTPPEQFRGEPSTESDLYALGATMYFLLTGFDPSPISVSSPRSRDKSISLLLDAIVRSATALDSEKRFDDAKWIKIELNALLPDLTHPEESADQEGI